MLVNDYILPKFLIVDFQIDLTRHIIVLTADFQMYAWYLKYWGITY